MKKLFKFISFFIFCIILTIILWLSPDSFYKSYQRAIVRQYDYLIQNKNSRKIILVGASTLAFGIDTNLMSQLTDRKCILLGNHAGFGHLFFLNMAEKNSQRGDIIVFEFSNNTPDQCGAELLLTGIGKRYDMYFYFHPKIHSKIFAGLFTYITKNIYYKLQGDYQPKGYDLSMFDNNGNMIANRLSYLNLNEMKADKSHFGYFNAKEAKANLSLEFLDLVNNIAKKCKAKGVEVYITFPPHCQEFVTSSKEDAQEYDNYISNKLTYCKTISKSIDYHFSQKYIYDGSPHLTTEGAKYRTQKLYNDLKPYLNP